MRNSVSHWAPLSAVRPLIPASSGDTIVHLTLTSDLSVKAGVSQNSISLCLSIQHHMTPRTLRNWRDRPARHVRWPFLHRNKAELSLCADLSTYAPRGLIFFYTTAAFILSDSQRIHWVNKLISTKDCDDEGLGALTVIIWPTRCPVNEPCSERNKMGWKQIGEHGVHVKSVLKPEFSTGDEGLFLSLRL